MRLDRFLTEANMGSRKEVKQLLKKKVVTVNGQVITDGKFQVNETQDEVLFSGEKLTYQEFYYYLLNKPAGVVSATEDRHDLTVMDLFSEADYRTDLFPVGRLDKDTEGLLLITNDGQLAHQLLSPKKHVDKEYYAQIAGVVTADDVRHFAAGFALNAQEKVKPSQLFIEHVDEAKDCSEIRLIIQEGKFHQVKRMFLAVDKEVTYLKRLRMGTLNLDESLALGAYRPLTPIELTKLTTKSE